MSDEPSAISLKGVSKIYRLYGSLTEQALDVFGLSKLLFWRRPRYTEHWALNGINLVVKRGERIGILGRNGAGKTTLLKIITGNFLPSSGQAVVNGAVQALMHVGLGFHPEFSGYDNIKSALAYNGLSGGEFDAALEDVVEFVELGNFLHQPMKTYSLGMQSRLMFATATAIRPDILIIDEILSAGDGYFSAKSAHRIGQLVFSGCTLLLVSHSTQQVLQFCNKAVWIEKGKVVMQGDALSVVKAYEEFTVNLEWQASHQVGEKKSVLENKELCEEILRRTLLGRIQHSISNSGSVAPGGISRWTGEKGLKISSVRVMSHDGKETAILNTGMPASLEMEVEAEEDGPFTCRYNFYIIQSDGKVLTSHCSEEDSFFLKKGERRIARLKYPSLLLGNGEYIFSAGVYKNLDLANLSSAVRYDILTRSFQFKVVDVYRDDMTLFHHPNVWEFA